MSNTIVFMGTPEFAAVSLEALVSAGYPPALVVTRPEKPRGRGLKQTPSEVNQAALRLGLPVEAPPKFHAPGFLERLRGLQPDLFVIVAYGVILRERALEIPRLGCINLHASLLPRWRGVSPIAWQILAGDPQVGVSTQWIDAGIDTGDVIFRDAFPMPEGATTGSLTRALAEHGGRLLVKTVRAAFEGAAPREHQDAVRATHAPKFGKREGWADWTWEAPRLERAVRAFDPWPGLKFRHESGNVRVVRAAAEPGPGGEPGRVLEVRGDEVRVACGLGELRLLEVQPDSKKAMSAGAWARGRGLAPGALLAGGPPE